MKDLLNDPVFLEWERQQISDEHQRIERNDPVYFRHAPGPSHPEATSPNYQGPIFTLKEDTVDEASSMNQWFSHLLPEGMIDDAIF